MPTKTVATGARYQVKSNPESLRNIQMRFLVNSSEYEALMQLAQDEGTNASAIIRRSLREFFRAIGHESDEQFFRD